MDSIHKLKLHECLEVEIKSSGDVMIWYRILRVPGGWIYMLWDVLHEVYTSPVFVPYSEEFSLP